jgi:hypothetical protein
MVDEQANVLLALDHNREIVLKKGATATERIATGITEDNYRKGVRPIYLSLTQGSSQRIESSN